MLWVCGGDFNEILSPGEKTGGDDWPFSDMLRFRNVLVCCDLMDMGYVGPKLTWDNRREDGANIQEGLDRFVAITE